MQWITSRLSEWDLSHKYKCVHHLRNTQCNDPLKNIKKHEKTTTTKCFLIAKAVNKFATQTNSPHSQHSKAILTINRIHNVSDFTRTKLTLSNVCKHANSTLIT